MYNKSSDFNNNINLKITIITTTYNSEKTIETNLESIQSQTLKNIEHIIIDNKSIDKTLSIVKKYPHVNQIISEHDKGNYDAMNKGINNAKGDIIGFLNSDDFYASNKILSKVMCLFRDNPSLDACYADLTYTDKVDINRTVRYWKSSDFILGSFSKGWCPPHPTFFVRQSAYKLFGNFNLNYSVASDVDLMMRFLEVNKISVTYVPEVWVKMRSGGMSNKNLKSILDQNLDILSALRKHNLPANPIIFFVYKIISRLKQFFQRPKG